MTYNKKFAIGRIEDFDNIQEREWHTEMTYHKRYYVGQGYLEFGEEEDIDLNYYSDVCHELNIAWWHDPVTGKYIQRNKGEQLMLIVSEIAEAMEGARKDLIDDKLPHRKMEEVELADALIRIFDYAGGHGLDLDGAFREKLRYNAERADHKPEHRVKEGGKKW
jgi:NTP pyrophosphatase (non-canonical NTP hydrolase)